MSERSREWVLERVRKLLTLGKNEGATEGERDNAMRMAHALLAKYNLDMAEVQLQTGEEQENRVILRSKFYGRPWARVVATHTARLFLCDYIYMEASKATDTQHFFIGKQSNAITACEMSAYLITSIQKEGRKNNPTKENIWLRSFCMGAAGRIHERVNDILAKSAEQKSAGTGTSLVLASLYDTERLANKQLKDEKFPNRSTPRQGKLDGIHSAFEEGREYADRLGLNRQIEGEKSKEQLEHKR